VFFSCDKKEKPLSIKGIWDEEISSVYDTINHSKIHDLDVDCDNEFSFVKTTYYRYYSSDTVYNMQSYDELVKGQYSIIDDKLYFNGWYYVSFSPEIPADSLNTEHNYGRYTDTSTYVIDEKCLMLNLDVLERQDIRRFAQREAYECDW
jgi:hypothetical protein